ALTAACAGTPVVPEPGDAPGAPSKADDLGQVSGLRGTYLVGNALTPGHDELSFTVPGDAAAEVVDAWIDRRFAQRAFAGAEGFSFSIDVSELGPGEHEILLAADGAPVAFAQRFFVRSHPLYVVVSTDWDDPDIADANLRRQEAL